MNIIKPSYKWNGSLSNRTKTEMIVLHHAAAINCTVEDIDSWHQGNGWAGIGYHFFIDKKGNVYEGRPIGAIGAHAQGFNYNSVGICVEGDYTKEKNMPEAQKNAVIETIAYVKKKYPDVTIKKHKDVCATSCPGKYYPFDEIVKGKSSASASTLDTSPDNVKEVQQYLNAKINAGLAVDGSYGPLTKKALIKYWQKTVGGLDVDGIFGTKSQAKASKNNLSKGAKGELVKIMQMALICKGYSLASYGADGSFGNYTKAVLEEFQKANGLTVDGICGKNTWKALFS